MQDAYNLWPLAPYPALRAALGNVLLSLRPSHDEYWTIPLMPEECEETLCPQTEYLWDKPAICPDDSGDGSETDNHNTTNTWLRVRPLPLDAPFTRQNADRFEGTGATVSGAACRGTLLWRGHLWHWVLDNLDILCAHPALRAIPPCYVSTLPDELQLAALELLLEPLLEATSTALGDAVTLGDCTLCAPETTKPLTEQLPARGGETFFDTERAVPLEWRVHVGKNVYHGLIYLLPPHAEAVRQLEQATHRVRRQLLGYSGDSFRLLIQRIPLMVAVLAGHVRLPLAEVATLTPGDIILPDQCFVAHGQVQLRVPPHRYGSRPCQTMICSLQGRALTVDGPFVTSITEFSMLDDPLDLEAQSPEQAGETAVAPEQLDVEICFELERRPMTLEELSALAPGSVLTLQNDIHAPVTLRAHGKIVGTGRLVDVDGIMGVQLLSVG